MGLDNLLVKKVIKREGKTIGVIDVGVEETLGHFADWLRVSARDIRRLNGFNYTRHIHIHERVKIPLEKVSKEEFEEKRLEYHKQIEEDFYASYKITDVEIYRIRRGDTIWTLSQEVFEIPLWLLKRYNAALDLRNLQPAQDLFIPVVERVG